MEQALLYMEDEWFCKGRQRACFYDRLSGYNANLR